MAAYLLRLGELTLKGRNRDRFVNDLIGVIKPRLKVIGGSYQKRHKKVIVRSEAHPDRVRQVLQTVAGVTSISPVHISALEPDAILQCAWSIVKPFVGTKKRFAVRAKRANKRFPLDSMEIQNKVAEHVFSRGLDLPVDLSNPELVLEVVIDTDQAWLFIERWPAMGGLPIQRKNRHGLLLSGGLDSPVAGHLIQKRGGQLEAIYFHTPPYTVEAAQEKVVELAQVLANRQNQLQLHVVNFTNIMKAIVASSNPSYMVVLSRRFMMRVATRIMEQVGGQSLVTGESLGQVASQTIENIAVINQGVTLPILRPLIGMDKQEIISIARNIGTFEISIRPYEDCCSLFAPDRPVTKASVARAEREERGLDVAALVDQAVELSERVTLIPNFD